MSTETLRRPSIEECQSQPRAPCEMSNEALLILSANGDVGARTERLIREIMAVDEVAWTEAARRVKHDILPRCTTNFEMMMGFAGYTSMMLLRLAYKETALWFNTRFVTADVPEPKDLETWLEVGTWTWGWMEPPLGTFSFAILCVQLGTQSLGPQYQRPFLQRRREQLLISQFPQYNSAILADFSEVASRGVQVAEGV
eukprot:CAMPEP_0181181408 /NCGR_PEP_ID=MMETSP1096-20121128/7323_1 /TAXON_ID=156174 ORGANISM="Chrysochromulina ericina, Strain CCMP281" /NCGR_SAMPLE_ID=MMETSP1096 /ASSEMBLY_ACC=CAM_ASM_000453 /LENGTH=198 /DNA_ID=CAMNT_0023269913 /DNA_START=59 /DNA_END=656 /DNA_ORIENTATION=+